MYPNRALRLTTLMGSLLAWMAGSSALLAAPGRVPCKKSTECEGVQVCVRGFCKEVGEHDSPSARLPPVRARPRARPAIRYIPEPTRCRRSTDCPDNQVCHKNRCHSLDEDPPKKPSRKRQFGDQGTLEAGGSLLFSYDRDNLDGLDGHFDTYRLQAGLYVGYFATRFFVLGLYLGIPYSESSYVTEDEYETYSTRDLGLSVVFAPGVAGAISRRVALYLDALVGFGYVGRLSTDASGDELRTRVFCGVVGAEAGVKILVSSHLLVRLGIRPTYWIGSAETEDDYGNSADADFDSVRIEVVLGFSYYR